MMDPTASVLASSSFTLQSRIKISALKHFLKYASLEDYIAVYRDLLHIIQHSSLIIRCKNFSNKGFLLMEIFRLTLNVAKVGLDTSFGKKSGSDSNWTVNELIEEGLITPRRRDEQYLYIHCPHIYLSYYSNWIPDHDIRRMLLPFDKQFEIDPWKRIEELDCAFVKYRLVSAPSVFSIVDIFGNGSSAPSSDITHRRFLKPLHVDSRKATEKFDVKTFEEYIEKEEASLREKFRFASAVRIISNGSKASFADGMTTKLQELKSGTNEELKSVCILWQSKSGISASVTAIPNLIKREHNKVKPYT